MTVNTLLPTIPWWRNDAAILAIRHRWGREQQAVKRRLRKGAYNHTWYCFLFLTSLRTSISHFTPSCPMLYLPKTQNDEKSWEQNTSKIVPLEGPFERTNGPFTLTKMICTYRKLAKVLYICIYSNIYSRNCFECSLLVTPTQIHLTGNWDFYLILNYFSLVNSLKTHGLLSSVCVCVTEYIQKTFFNM